MPAVTGILLPLTEDDSAWLASGTETFHPRSDTRQVARLAIEMATREPELVFRNAEKVKQGWEHMRRDREEFLAFFGTDELVLPTLEAEGRLNAYYRRRRDAAPAARGGRGAAPWCGTAMLIAVGHPPIAMVLLPGGAGRGGRGVVRPRRVPPAWSPHPACPSPGTGRSTVPAAQAWLGTQGLGIVLPR